MTYTSSEMASTENISTSIRIRQTPERRRKSLDETAKGGKEPRVHSPGGIYYLQHKIASRSLDDLNGSFDEDVIMVNGSPSSVQKTVTTTTVKSAAVIRLTGGKERSDERMIKTLSGTKGELIGDSNNNSVFEVQQPLTNTNDNDDVDIVEEKQTALPEAITTSNYQQKRKLRNKSASDVLGMNVPRSKSSIKNSYDVSASVDNIYENGQYTKLVESDNETLDGSTLTLSSRSSSSKSRPQKPKRSNASLNRTFDYDHGKVLPPLDIGDREIANYHRELNTSFDKHNNLSISKENFDAFISREKKNYSGQVSSHQPFVCVSEDDLSSDSRSRIQSWESDSANASFTTESQNHESKTVDESKVKELGEVLDSQLDSLENLLSASAPPRRSSASYNRRARSYENVCEKKRLSDIEETQSRQNSRMNVNRLSYDLLNDREDRTCYIEPQNRNTLPEVPRGMSFKDRIKSIKRSLSTSRKRIVKKNGRNIEFPGLRKSFRLSKSFRARKRSVSLKDVSEQKDSNSNGRLIDDQNVVLRREASARRLFSDNRSSRVIAHECDVMKAQLSVERQKVGILKCFTSYLVHETNMHRL